VCGVRDAVLVQRELPIDPYAPHLGHITGFVHPVSGQTVGDVRAAHLGMPVARHRGGSGLNWGLI
jgi:hypothetical protein